MKPSTIHTCALGVLMSVLLGGCQSASNQDPSTKEISLNAYKQLFVMGNKFMDVSLLQGPEYKLLVKGCATEDMAIESADSSLMISMVKKTKYEPVTIGVIAPSFSDIKCFFSRSLTTSETLVSDYLSLAMTGIPEADIAVRARTLKVTYTDEAHCVLAGSCDEADVVFSGVPNTTEGMAFLEAKKLQTRSMHISCGVLSDIEISVSDSLWLMDGMDCVIRVFGHPVIVQNNLKSCELHMMDSVKP